MRNFLKIGNTINYLLVPSHIISLEIFFILGKPLLLLLINIIDFVLVLKEILCHKYLYYYLATDKISYQIIIKIFNFLFFYTG